MTVYSKTVLWNTDRFHGYRSFEYANWHSFIKIQINSAVTILLNTPFITKKIGQKIHPKQNGQNANAPHTFLKAAKF